MPIIVQKTTPDRTESALTLANKVLQEVRLDDVDTLEGDGVPIPAKRALDFLNAIEQDLYNALNGRYGQDTWEEPLIAGQANYDLPSDWQDIAGDPRIVDHQLKPLTVDQWDDLVDDRFILGTPTHYLLKDGQVFLWPVPDGSFMRYRCVYDDGGFWPCAITHRAGEDAHRAPSAGDTASWGTDTDFSAAMVSWAGDEDDYSSSDFAWADGTYYYRGYMDTPYTKGLTIMANNDDTPTIPAQFYPHLLAGAYWRMKAHRGFTAAEVAEAKSYYNDMVDDLLIRRRFQHNYA